MFNIHFKINVMKSKPSHYRFSGYYETKLLINENIDNLL